MLIVVVFLTFLESNTIRLNAPVTIIPVIFLLKIWGFIIALFTVGYYVRKTDKIVLEEESIKVISDPKSKISKSFCYVIILIILISEYFLVMQLEEGKLPLFFIIVGCYAYIVFIGYYLPSIMNVYIIIASYLYNLIICLFLFILLTMTYFIVILMNIIKFILDILSRPYLMFFKRVSYEQ